MDLFKNYLKSISPITDEEFEKTSIMFRTLNLQKGEFFVQADKTCRQIGFILKGMMRIFYVNEKDDEITSCFCSTGSFTTSYKSFILQEPSSQSIQALEDTVLLVINYDDLQLLYTQHPVWQLIGRTVSEHEYILLEHYVSGLNSESAKAKYLRFMKEYPDVNKKVQVEYIASFLGITRRTLSRIRKELTSEPLSKTQD